jgi:hypothetical protein
MSTIATIVELTPTAEASNAAHLADTLPNLNPNLQLQLKESG